MMFGHTNYETPLAGPGQPSGQDYWMEQQNQANDISLPLHVGNINAGRQPTLLHAASAGTHATMSTGAPWTACPQSPAASRDSQPWHPELAPPQPHAAFQSPPQPLSQQQPHPQPQRPRSAILSGRSVSMLAASGGGRSDGGSPISSPLKPPGQARKASTDTRAAATPLERSAIAQSYAQSLPYWPPPPPLVAAPLYPPFWPAAPYGMPMYDGPLPPTLKDDRHEWEPGSLYGVELGFGAGELAAGAAAAAIGGAANWPSISGGEGAGGEGAGGLWQVPMPLKPLALQRQQRRRSALVLGEYDPEEACCSPLKRVSLADPSGQYYSSPLRTATASLVAVQRTPAKRPDGSGGAVPSPFARHSLTSAAASSTVTISATAIAAAAATASQAPATALGSLQTGDCAPAPATNPATATPPGLGRFRAVSAGGCGAAAAAAAGTMRAFTAGADGVRRSVRSGLQPQAQQQQQQQQQQSEAQPSQWPQGVPLSSASVGGRQQQAALSDVSNLEQLRETVVGDGSLPAKDKMDLLELIDNALRQQQQQEQQQGPMAGKLQHQQSGQDQVPWPLHNLQLEPGPLPGASSDLQLLPRHHFHQHHQQALQRPGIALAEAPVPPLPAAQALAEAGQPAPPSSAPPSSAGAPVPFHRIPAQGPVDDAGQAMVPVPEPLYDQPPATEYGCTGLPDGGLLPVEHSSTRSNGAVGSGSGGGDGGGGAGAPGAGASSNYAAGNAWESLGVHSALGMPLSHGVAARGQQLGPVAAATHGSTAFGVRNSTGGAAPPAGGAASRASGVPYRTAASDGGSQASPGTGAGSYDSARVPAGAALAAAAAAANAERTATLAAAQLPSQSAVQGFAAPLSARAATSSVSQAAGLGMAEGAAGRLLAAADRPTVGVAASGPTAGLTAALGTPSPQPPLSRLGAWGRLATDANAAAAAAAAAAVPPSASSFEPLGQNVALTSLDGPAGAQHPMQAAAQPWPQGGQLFSCASPQGQHLHGQQHLHFMPEGGRQSLAGFDAALLLGHGNTAAGGVPAGEGPALWSFGSDPVTPHHQLRQPQQHQQQGSHDQLIPLNQSCQTPAPASAAPTPPSPGPGSPFPGGRFGQPNLQPPGAGATAHWPCGPTSEGGPDEFMGGAGTSLYAGRPGGQPEPPASLWVAQASVCDPNVADGGAAPGAGRGAAAGRDMRPASGTGLFLLGPPGDFPDLGGLGEPLADTLDRFTEEHVMGLAPVSASTPWHDCQPDSFRSVHGQPMLPGPQPRVDPGKAQLLSPGPGLPPYCGPMAIGAADPEEELRCPGTTTGGLGMLTGQAFGSGLESVGGGSGVGGLGPGMGMAAHISSGGAAAGAASGGPWPAGGGGEVLPSGDLAGPGSFDLLDRWLMRADSLEPDPLLVSGGGLGL